jgi:hypothetical protein
MSHRYACIALVDVVDQDEGKKKIDNWGRRLAKRKLAG